MNNLDKAVFRQLVKQETPSGFVLYFVTQPFISFSAGDSIIQEFWVVPQNSARIMGGLARSALGFTWGP